MTFTIIVNDTEFAAFDWHEEPISTARHATSTETPLPHHARGAELLEKGVHRLYPGEARFRCDQTLAFDTTFSLKADNRQFVIIHSDHGHHVAKPY